MWYDVSDKTILSDDALLSVLSDSTLRVVILEGPTGCGKTRLIRKLNDTACRSTCLLSCEVFRRSLLCRIDPAESTPPFESLISGREIICIEDIDFMSGLSATLKESAALLSSAAQHSLVILTGICCRERIAPLISSLTSPPQIWEYRSEK